MSHVTAALISGRYLTLSHESCLGGSHLRPCASGRTCFSLPSTHICLFVASQSRQHPCPVRPLRAPNAHSYAAKPNWLITRSAALYATARCPCRLAGRGRSFTSTGNHDWPHRRRLQRRPAEKTQPDPSRPRDLSPQRGARRRPVTWSAEPAERGGPARADSASDRTGPLPPRP